MYTRRINRQQRVVETPHVSLAEVTVPVVLDRGFRSDSRHRSKKIIGDRLVVPTGPSRRQARRSERGRVVIGAHASEPKPMRRDAMHGAAARVHSADRIPRMLSTSPAPEIVKFVERDAADAARSRGRSPSLQFPRVHGVVDPLHARARYETNGAMPRKTRLFRRHTPLRLYQVLFLRQIVFCRDLHVPELLKVEIPLIHFQFSVRLLLTHSTVVHPLLATTLTTNARDCSSSTNIGAHATAHTMMHFVVGGCTRSPSKNKLTRCVEI